jgi:DNA polymerase delta subunit 1
MIEETKRQVEAHFVKANGYEHDAVVVYGDTDSVFVKFGCDSVEEAMKLGEDAAGRISTTFIKPIKLEFEKVYYPFLLMNKKRYAGLYWTRPETFDKMDAKGIETVRRDNCELVKIVVETVLDIVLKERSIEKAVNYVQSVVADLLQNKVDLSMLVISKSLAKGADSEAYAVKTAHVELAERMRQRDPSTAPNTGDRVQYVMIKASKGAKGYEKAEDPLYVLENGLTIDGEYYIEHQLKQPLLRLFENVINNVESKLFAGEHTRKVVNMTPAVGGLSGFVKKSLKCLGCKCVVQSGAFCDYCVRDGKEAPVLLSKVEELRSLEVQFAKLWSQCQRCQGSHIQDVLCTSRDCPIFYRRAKVRKDAAQAADTVRRLMDTSEW